MRGGQLNLIFSLYLPSFSRTIRVLMITPYFVSIAHEVN